MDKLFFCVCLFILLWGCVSVPASPPANLQDQVEAQPSPIASAPLLAPEDSLLDDGDTEISEEMPTELPPPQAVTRFRQRLDVGADKPLTALPVLGADHRWYVLNGGDVSVFNGEGQALQHLHFLDPVVTPPVFTALGFLLGHQSGDISHLNATGDIVWKRSDMSPAYLNAPKVVNEHMLVVSEQGAEVFGLDLNTGNTKWVFDTQTFAQRSPTVGPDN